MHRINLLQLVHGFGLGGAELKLLELLSRLDRNKYNVTLVTVGKRGFKEKDFINLGFPTYIIPKCRRFDVSLPFKLAKVMRQTTTELMMSTLYFADIIGAAATMLHKPRVFMSWEAITGQLKWHQKLMYRLLAGRFDIVAAVSNSIHPFIVKVRKQKSEKIRTIYYGVDLNKYQPLLKKESENGEIVFGTVARLVHQKGHSYLLDAIPTVFKKYPKARWHFVGTGAKEKELRAKASALGIDHAITFWGKQFDVRRFLNSFDVFVLPSLWEGFPNVLLEAMASAIPVIATEVEGTIELVVDGETGFLVPKKNPQALAGAMIKIAENPELIAKYGANGRHRVEEQFSLQKQVREFEALYDELMEARVH